MDEEEEGKLARFHRQDGVEATSPVLGGVDRMVK